MSIRIKKLIGTVVMIILVSVYAIFATAYATLYLADASGWTHLAFFALTCILWVLPAMFLIRWMEGYKGKPRA